MINKVVVEMSEFFGGNAPRTISWDELERMNNGLRRDFIPRAEVPEAYIGGKMQQLEQQQQTGGRLYVVADCE